MSLSASLILGSCAEKGSPEKSEESFETTSLSDHSEEKTRISTDNKAILNIQQKNSVKIKEIESKTDSVKRDIEDIKKIIEEKKREGSL